MASSYISLARTGFIGPPLDIRGVDKVGTGSTTVIDNSKGLKEVEDGHWQALNGIYHR